MTTDAKTPTLLIKADNASLLSGRFELNGHPIKADKITLEMDANDGARLTLDVAAYDGLDLVLPATAAVTLWLSEPGTLEVNGSERGIAEPIEVTPGEVSRRWTFRQQESTPTAVAVVRAVLASLRGRKGFRDLVDEVQLDAETWSEMETELADVVLAAIRGEAGRDGR